MKKIVFSLLLTFITALTADTIPHDSFENMKVGEITVDIKNGAPAENDRIEAVLTEMRLKPGDTFSQVEFDSDLKRLSKKYQIVDPVITKKDGKLIIRLDITLRPTIVKFTVNGSKKYKKKKILSKGELTVPMEYNRGKFYQSITDIRDFLIKRGYFKADVTYKIEETPGTGEAIAHIFINQGPLGHIHKIKLKGFTKKEKRAVLRMIKTSKFHILTNWIIGSGVLKEEEQAQDAQMVTRYIQGEGYIDAKVRLEVKNTKQDQLTLFIYLDRGDLYHVGDVKIIGNTLETEKALDKALILKKGDVFTEEKIQATQKRIQSLYTKQGYLDTNVGYELIPAGDHSYNVVFQVEESEKYKVGLIVVSGNKSTNNNVIYNNVDITPGDDFDTNKMNAAQRRLQSTGYFENVSVYAVKNEKLAPTDANYRNVMIEVKEKRSGSVHLSAGTNSTAQMFGEISLNESNFDIHGLSTMWTDGVGALRGGGQFVDVKATYATKDKSASITWVNPYINDSLWRLGVDIQGKKDNTIADYTLWSYGAGINTMYPINPYFSGGVKFRAKNSIVIVDGADKKATLKQERNSGIASGGGLVFAYNTTDNPYVPSKGIKSNFEAEFIGLVRENSAIHDFPFLKFGYLNSYYKSLWNNAIFKVRGDLRFIQPLWRGTSEDMPLTEKFFLGGVESMRGYAPGQIGPAFAPEVGEKKKDDERDPTGGISSALLSFELLQKVLPVLDVFTFFDAGAINESAFRVGKIYMSTGVGIRVNMGQTLPFVFGWGYPINPDEWTKSENNPQEQRFFWSMAGRF
ncbi:MAG: Outer membrane protein assembly factor BamA [Chlamydiia bacterium]|nr:Outer membrane protein assembly factor BamA [Chlamydiia bacterium]MCH9618002.1 Outer membrane protein assembly factor BamA [Chlamydiia bacterium]MCH9623673.1 Outer membrane protein assembly factor BamA [Chlamydiia bacterium]